MFSVIRHYHFDAKNGAEIDGKIRESFVPLIKKAKSLSLIFRNLEALTLAPTFNEPEPEGPTAGWVYGAVSLLGFAGETARNLVAVLFAGLGK